MYQRKTKSAVSTNKQKTETLKGKNPYMYAYSKKTKQTTCMFYFKICF